MFDFGILKKSLANYGDTLKRLQAEIEALHRQREDVLFAPTTRDDARAAMAQWVTSQAAAYRASISAGVTELALNRVALEDPKRFGELAARLPLVHKRVYGPADGPVDLAICALMGDAMVKAFDSVLEQMEWPSGALSVVQRKKKLDEIDARLAELVESEKQMTAAASDAGVSIDLVA
ncbi:hypothetical protein [Polaromonas sp.]|uniref:hypothetical protein n=1 Tax=Polaromonas sp. TaxID=1869339 RepID=UPI0037511574